MEIRNIAIIGAGTMGRLMTRWALEYGYNVFVCDRATSNLDALKREFGAASGVSSRFETLTDLDKIGDSAHLVMETIPDRIEAKRDLLERLDAICPRELVLASCSATIPITLLEETVEQRNRVVIANFWFDTPLVEVVRGTSTDEQTVDSVMQYSRTLGKHPVLLSKDCPGHVCCRMFLGQVYRALRILEAGVATAEDIDICMTLGSAYSSGILRRCDRMGLDFVQQAFLIMYELTGEPRFKPNRVIEQKVEAGKLGEKTGEGFFTWPDR